MDRRGSRLGRRRFVLSATGAALLAGCGRLPWQAEQPAAKIPRIGWMGTSSPGPTEAFLTELRTLGYEPGRNLIIEYRPDREDWAALAAELINLPVDVLVTSSATPTLAAKRATDSVPIVMLGVPDPEGEGLVSSLARPGGNITGFSNLNKGLTGKRLQLLLQAFPTVSQVARLGDSNNAASVQSEADMRAAAEALGVRLRLVDVPQPADPTPNLDAAKQGGADALIVATGSLAGPERAEVIEFVAAYRWPAIYPNKTYVVEGGLMSYAGRGAELERRAATYVDKILKGAKPADLPIEQPMTFDFVVNMKTARALGITFPNEILLQVTEVIE